VICNNSSCVLAQVGADTPTYNSIKKCQVKIQQTNEVTDKIGHIEILLPNVLLYSLSPFQELAMLDLLTQLLEGC
jgi:hypothetical protein